jgi:hypothetical protein
VLFLSLFVLLLAATFLTGRPSASAQDLVRVGSGSVISLQTPQFVQVGKRYAFTWAGGGPAQTYMVKSKREDGWVLVEVADENTNPIFLSIQEMRPHQ